jgi:hypothetical protein
MDAELREAIGVLHSKIDSLSVDIRDHMVSDMKTVTEIHVCMGAHKETLRGHLDDHKETQKWWMAIWGAVIVTFLIGAWNWFKGVPK